MDGLLREAISLLPLVGAAAGVLAVVLVAAAFVMAESGELLDSWFGRTVFYAAPAASGIWVLVSELTPEVLGALKLERLDAALLLFAAVGARRVRGVGRSCGLAVRRAGVGMSAHAPLSPAQRFVREALVIAAIPALAIAVRVAVGPGHAVTVVLTAYAALGVAACAAVWLGRGLHWRPSPDVLSRRASETLEEPLWMGTLRRGFYLGSVGFFSILVVHADEPFAWRDALILARASLMIAPFWLLGGFVLIVLERRRARRTKDGA